ncbi:MAG TPA: sterol desaturase family protein [Solimonas sp.]|nr:sterol desaturase family protein [Solimonas sp.]
MGDTSVVPKIVLLLGLMAILAIAETWIPLRDFGQPRAQRWRPNLALTLVFLLMNLLLTAGVLGLALWMERRQLGPLHWLGLPAPVAFVLGIVLLDGFAYLAHMLMHRVPWLWRVHRVHHSDAAVDVTTTFRQHPLETLLRFAFTALPAVLLGVSPAATAAYRLMSGVNALFEHANLRVAAPLDRGLRWLLVTPHMHKVHHSRRQAETDSNYGNILSAFDRVFGTYTPTERAAAVRYGLDEFGDEGVQSFTALVQLPWTQQPEPDRQSRFT